MQSNPARLFVILDPTAPHQTALIKATLIAKLADCHIHAYMCVYRDIEKNPGYSSRKDLKHHVLKDARSLAEKLMQNCRDCGVSYTIEIDWNANWVESVLHAVARSNCDLLIKSSFRHSKTQRFFNPTSDYRLMRNCACPILLAHQTQEWQSDRILACLDLESNDPGHLHLNNVILREAMACADIFGMDLYIASAMTDKFDETHLLAELQKQVEIIAPPVQTDQFDRNRIILRQGETIETLNSICAELEPSIVVIGTLARQGIAGRLIGNTAEKLLDLIDADLVTVN